MSHLQNSQKSEYQQAFYPAEGAAVGDEVSNLYENDVSVLHAALHQAVIMEQRALWHEFNRRKIAEVSMITLTRKCEELHLRDMDRSVLRRIVEEAETSNRARAADPFSMGFPAWNERELH